MEDKSWIQLTPQQEIFLNAFLNPQSETFSNYTQSALKAGYSFDYANTISAHMPKWLKSALDDNSLVSKAIENLNKFLDDDKNPNIKADMTKFTLSRLAKDKFSERREHTGKDGKDLTINVIKYGGDDTPQI